MASLQCIAIIGSKNSPLYLCDTTTIKEENAATALPEGEDCFGFSDPEWNQNNRSCKLSIRHEVSIRALLQRSESVSSFLSSENKEYSQLKLTPNPSKLEMENFSVHVTYSSGSVG